MPSNMNPTDLELEHVLRHLVNTEPSMEQWMIMGNVDRGALNGLADASNFNRGTEERVKGLVNAVVPYGELETTTIAWCQQMLEHSPLAMRCLKSAFNADCDGQTGLQELAGNATLLYYMTDEAKEGHRSFLKKQPPNFSKFPKRP